MASTTVQCMAPQLLGRGWEASCLGGAAVASKCNSCAGTGSGIVANFARSGSGGFEKAFLSGSGVINRSSSKSGRLSGSVDLPWNFGSDGHPYSDMRQRCGNARGLPVHATEVQAPVQAIEKLPGNVEMLETYEIEEKVRDYELDHYGVVNNAIYAQFCQHARTELLENIGFSPDAVTESGKAMAISDMTMKFISPLRSGDRYIVSSRVAGTTAVRLIFEDHIYRLPERELVMSAKSTVVVLDHNSKPGRLPEEIKAKLVNGYSTNFPVKLGKTSNGDLNGHSKKARLTDNTTIDFGNDNARNVHVNVRGNSKTGHVNGDSRTGSPVDVYVDGNSRTREVSLVA